MNTCTSSQLTFFHRAIGATELARVAAHHRLPLRLRHLRLAQRERRPDGHPVLRTFSVIAVFFTGWTIMALAKAPWDWGVSPREVVFCLPVGPGSGYSGVNQEWMGYPSGKCRIKGHIGRPAPKCFGF
jgi:hypothetical protein